MSQVTGRTAIGPDLGSSLVRPSGGGSKGRDYDRGRRSQTFGIDPLDLHPLTTTNVWTLGNLRLGRRRSIRPRKNGQSAVLVQDQNFLPTVWKAVDWAAGR